MLYITVLNKHSYLHDSAVTLRSKNFASVNYSNVYLLLEFLSSHREKEKEYESWVNSISWAKRNMS